MKNNFIDSTTLDGLVESTNTQIPLSYALKRYRNEDFIIDIIQEQKRTDLNSKNKKTGNTALHTAIISGKTRVALALIKAGVNLDTMNEKGETPLDISKRLGYDEVSIALIKKGAKAKKSDKASLVKTELTQKKIYRKQRSMSF